MSDSGVMRSARLGTTLNASSALRNATLCAAVTGNASAGTCRPPSGNASILDYGPTAVLSAAVTLWGPAALPNVTAAPAAGVRAFSLTLTGASLVVVRAPRAPFIHASNSSGLNATLGGAICSILAVSTDGAWALLQTPTPLALCGSETAECGYATLRLATRPSAPGITPAYNGAAVSCPPICPGAVNPPASVPAVTAASGGDAVLASLETDAVTGALSVNPLPAAAAVSQGVFYTLACSQVRR